MAKLAVAAMSGGVDSSVAAALLQREGFKVVGVTMCFSLPDTQSGRPACCGAEAIDDARRVCDKLGVKHYVLDFAEELRTLVLENFLSEYSHGRTPNPCVRCNELLKFGKLLAHARALGAEFLATGHYARITTVGGLPRLARATDPQKDQSYFLYRLREEKMRYLRFPNGEYDKSRIRDIARELGLKVAEKPDSQEICFIPDKEALDGMRLGATQDSRPGPITDIAGRVIGSHGGTSLYTVGQRRGLGVAAAQPLYVVRINAKDNTIVAGTLEEAHATEFTVRDIVWPGDTLEQSAHFDLRIRHSQTTAPALVSPLEDGTARVVFDNPQFGIAPGQSAVFYSGDIVCGGGIIDEVF